MFGKFLPMTTSLIDKSSRTDCRQVVYAVKRKIGRVLGSRVSGVAIIRGLLFGRGWPAIGASTLMELIATQAHRVALLRDKPPGQLLIHEVYRSIQGESTFAGLPCVFVRLAVCDARCSWCDTPHAFTQG